MAQKTIILTPAGLTVPDVISGGYPTYLMPDNLVSRCIIPCEGGVPADFTSMSSVELIILTENTGNLYLRAGSNRFDVQTPGILQTSTSSYAAYAGGTADNKTKFIALPSTMWSSLANINAADVMNFVVDRDAVDVLDTYSADLNIIGIRIVYIVGYIAGPHYCNQTDLEYKLSTATLAALTNDTANATTPNANVLELILSNVDATIDAEVGEIYEVPFDPTPDIIKRIAIDLAVYECFQRRPVNIEMPKMWQEARDKAMKQLEAISDMLLQLPATATIGSTKSAIVANDLLIDFNDTNNPMSDF